jgi:hypothetical protein
MLVFGLVSENVSPSPNHCDRVICRQISSASSCSSRVRLRPYRGSRNAIVLPLIEPAVSDKGLLHHVLFL